MVDTEDVVDQKVLEEVNEVEKLEYIIVMHKLFLSDGMSSQRCRLL